MSATAARCALNRQQACFALQLASCEDPLSSCNREAHPDPPHTLPCLAGRLRRVPAAARGNRCRRRHAGPEPGLRHQMRPHHAGLHQGAWLMEILRSAVDSELGGAAVRPPCWPSSRCVEGCVWAWRSTRVVALLTCHPNKQPIPCSPSPNYTSTGVATALTPSTGFHPATHPSGQLSRPRGPAAGDVRAGPALGGRRGARLLPWLPGGAGRALDVLDFYMQLLATGLLAAELFPASITVTPMHPLCISRLLTCCSPARCGCAGHPLLP